MPKLHADWKLPSPLPKNTETLLELALATARSSAPSPLKSPTATETGVLPTVRLCAGWKLPSPELKSTETLFERELATARSGTPSPLKSPAATKTGLRPVSKSRRAMNDTLCAWGAAADSRWLTASPAQTDALPLFEIIAPSHGLEENPPA